VREINQFDLRLYRAARDKLDTEINRQPASFRREMAAFRLLNRTYGKAAAARRKLSALRGG
ncbi:MAG: hypothetical protein U9Q71_00725, partial [Pseudomonadota bacterium]|nr:hypothetical protein [Pseudomonadota bacterium]